MEFSSIPFLFYYIPVVMILYYFSPQRFKNLVMILAGFVFYAWGEIRFIPVLLVLSAEDYICARLMEKYRENKKKRRVFMLISVCSNLGVLFFFKYAVRRHIVRGANCTLFSVNLPPRLCRTGTCRRLQTE